MTALVLALLLTATSTGDDKPIVMVEPFQVAGTDPELQALGKGFADMVAGDLVAWDGVAVVDRQRLQDAIAELKLQRTKYFDPKTRLQVGKFLGARYAVSGVLAVNGGKLQIQAAMREIDTQLIKAQAKVAGNSDDVFELEQELVDKLSVSIDAKLRDPGRRRMVKVPSLAVLVDYSNALDLSDQGDVEAASKAFAAVVSRVPTFGLARERKAQALQKLAELAERRKELITESVLWVAKQADSALARESAFDSLDEDAQLHLMAMRLLKGRVILRQLKQHLSNHEKSLRLVLKGHEAAALKLLRSWVENQRRLLDEEDRFARQRAQYAGGERLPVSLSYKVPNELERKLVESGLGGVSLASRLQFDELARFVLTGWGSDGQRFHVAPALGDLDPKEEQAVVAELDRRVAEAIKAEQAKYKAGEHEFTSLLEFKADWLIRNDRIDDAVGAYQQILDAAPQGYRANSVEQTIKEIIENRGNRLHRRREWDEALKTCDDMAIRGGILGTDGYVYRQGIAGYDTIAELLLKACGAREDRSSAIAQALAHIARGAAVGGDCERAVKYYRRNIEFGGSFSEMQAFNRNSITWCDFSSITPQTSPTRVRVSVGGGDMRSEERSLAAVAAEVITFELRARGYVIGPESSYRGGDRRIWVYVELGRKEAQLGLQLLKDSDDDGADAQVRLRSDQFDLDALLAPVLAHMRPGTKVVDDKPHPSLPMPLLEGLVELVDLVRERKRDDASKKLDALQKQYADFRVLDDMRAELEKLR